MASLDEAQSHNVVFTIGFLHTFPFWRRWLALVQCSVIEMSLGLFGMVPSEPPVVRPAAKILDGISPIERLRFR